MQTAHIENHDGPLIRVSSSTSDEVQYTPYPHPVCAGDSLTMDGETVNVPAATMLRSEDDAIEKFRRWQNAGY